ncbi:hypothetical protein [Absidia glauca]|uniref:Uncharacterized protein n=1 Tax=Absidia glauca TaxID=4829 RepID=A0A163TDL9_ABSGL|nr:hypothetical protein [Absidia glauca]
MISSTTSYLSIPTIKFFGTLRNPQICYQHQAPLIVIQWLQKIPDSQLWSDVKQVHRFTVSSSSSSRLTVPKQYGSFLGIPLSDDSLSFESVAPPTPPHTTIRSDEDDAGLYLLWKQQLLREQGYQPQDDTDDESSLSDASVDILPPSTSFGPDPFVDMVLVLVVTVRECRTWDKGKSMWTAWKKTIANRMGPHITRKELRLLEDVPFLVHVDLPW